MTGVRSPGVKDLGKSFEGVDVELLRNSGRAGQRLD